MKKNIKSETVTKSSGNVFADMGRADAADALAKAKLAHRICQAIAERGLTQTAAAKILGLDQPKISALVRGRLRGFSAERLLRFLNDLGQDVEIVIRPSNPKRRGDVRVVAVAM